MSKILDSLLLKDTKTGEATEYQIQDSQLKARVDNLIANAGNTDDNAELIDIRVGEDGTQYPTAGEAVRGQVSKLKGDLAQLSEQTKNLVSTDDSKYLTYQNNGNSSAKFEDDSLTVTVEQSGTYRYVYQIVDTTNIDNLIVSAESNSGNGQGYLRIGTINGSSITWIANGSGVLVSADVSAYDSVVVAIYACSTNNGSVGTYETYHRLQIESGTFRSKYISPVTAKDLIVREELKKTSDDVDELRSRIEGGEKVYDFDTVGYINFNTGAYSNYGDGQFMCTDFIPILDGWTYEAYCRNSASVDGIAFYNAEKTYISGYQKFNLFDPLQIPTTAKYMRLTNTTSYADNPYVKAKINGVRNRITINCYGDSTTQGMGVNGAYYARYGESPYPARLKTLLVDNGYNDVDVNNFGHGGERTTEICARAGAYPCYITEDLSVSGDGTTRTSLGTAVVTNGKVTGTKMRIADGSTESDDSYISFTAWSHDTNPVLIDGVAYNMTWMNDNDSLVKANADGVNVTIPKGSMLLTNTKKCGDVSIIYMGINDGSSLTIEKWVERCHAIANMNGGKYIIIGSTHGIWSNWQTPTGTSAERYEKYKRTCMKEFGIHWIDMYDEFARHAMDYALSAGYYSTLSDEKIAEMRSLLSNHIIPKEMSYDGNSQGNVHLSEEGYHVMAMIIFERLKRLNYI